MLAIQVDLSGHPVLRFVVEAHRALRIGKSGRTRQKQRCDGEAGMPKEHEAVLPECRGAVTPGDDEPPTDQLPGAPIRREKRPVEPLSDQDGERPGPTTELAPAPSERVSRAT